MRSLFVLCAASLILLLTGCPEVFCFASCNAEDAGIATDSCISGNVKLLGALAAGADGARMQYARQKITRALDESGSAEDLRENQSLAEQPIANALSPTGRVDELKPRVRESARPGLPREPDWAPGHLVVILEQGRFSARQARALIDTFLVQEGHSQVRATKTRCVAGRLCRFLLETESGKLLDKQETKRVVDDFNASSIAGLLHASTNNIFHALRLPNDTFYTLQRWHFEFPNLPSAWDITTGDDNIVVAILDTGLNLSHPDVQGRVAQGIDMVSNINVSGDNDGIDLTPNDPGIGTNFHGTHVAGIVGANSNNNLGVSGVMWSGKIQPIRVLGNGTSGQSFDILSGLYWAIGETQFDVEDPAFAIPALNDTPARVVNLSLGAAFEANDFELWRSTAEDVLVTRAANYGYPIIVVAAGNENQAADNVTPANVPELLTVTAHRYDGNRAVYANWGNLVDLAAPGGQSDLDQNGDGYPDAVLSLQANDYNYEQGTSMASPHVAGIIGLMLSVDPSLSHQDVVSILRQTAFPFSQTACPENCGAGYVDAAAALVALGGVIVAGPQLSVDQSVVLFPTGINTLDLRLRNLGDTNAQYELDVLGPQAGSFTLGQASGSVPAQGTAVVSIAVNRDVLESGFANLEITGIGDADGQQFYVDLAFNDRIVPPKFTITTVQVGAFTVAENGNYITRGSLQVIARRTNNFAYEICGLEENEYFVFGIGDDNSDGIYDATTESFGGWPVASAVEGIALETNTSLSGVEFALSGGFVLDGAGAVGQPCLLDDECSWAADAACIVPDAGWPNGYCSRICDDGYCGGGASCEALQCGDAPCNVCLITCTSESQCRGPEGYICDTFNTCSPNGFSP